LGEPYESGLFAVDTVPAAAAAPATVPAAAPDSPPATPGSSGSTRPDAAGAITTTSMGRWERDLVGADREAMRRIAGERLIELGYATDLDW
jgi:hypothetical protein